MLNKIKKYIDRLICGQSHLHIKVDLTEPGQAMRALQFKQWITTGKLPGQKPPPPRPIPQPGISVMLWYDGEERLISRETHTKYCEVMDYLYEHPEEEQLGVRQLAPRLGISKSHVSNAKRNWEDNKARWAAFRQDEEEHSPF